MIPFSGALQRVDKDYYNNRRGCRHSPVNKILRPSQEYFSLITIKVEVAFYSSLSTRCQLVKTGKNDRTFRVYLILHLCTIVISDIHTRSREYSYSCLIEGELIKDNTRLHGFHTHEHTFPLIPASNRFIKSRIFPGRISVSFLPNDQ